MNAIRRIGILTGGGDCPGLNAVIRAVVRAAARERVETVGIYDGFEGLLEPTRARVIPVAETRGILGRGGTILGTTNRSNPFRHEVTEGDTVKTVDRSDEALANARALGLGALIVVGGDGTQGIGYRFHQLGLPVVGVPKTIDNDLSGTDVTFGFDTALSVVSEALDRLQTTAESHHRVMIVEVMGRNAGWIALQAGLAGGADVILIPEIPFRIERVVERIGYRDPFGRRHRIVVVAEGAAPVGGQQLMVGSGERRSPLRLGGIGAWLERELLQRCQHEVRATVLGYLQRGGSPTAFDRILATRFGTAAVEAVLAGKVGQMVALRGTEIVTAPLTDALVAQRLVPADGQLVQTARTLGVSLGD